MADEKTGVDSLRIYLTGASSHEGAQTDPDQSLGNYQSSTMFTPLGSSWASLMANITVVRITGANSTGSGILTAEGVNSLSWTPPSGTKGATVTIANGETKLLPGGGGETHKSIIVTRTTADNLTGTATVTLSDNFANLFDNVSSAEASAGDNEYRCLTLVNKSSGTVSNIKVKLGTLGDQVTSDDTQLGSSGAGSVVTSDTISSGTPDTGAAIIREADGTIREVVYYSSRTSTTLTVPAAGRGLLGTSAAAGAADDTVDFIPPVAISKEAPSGQPAGYFTDKTGSGEGVEPSGLTWRFDVDFSGTPVDIGDIVATNIYGLWFWREVPAGMAAESDLQIKVIIQYDAT